MLNSLKMWFYRRLALNYMTAGKSEAAEKWYKRIEVLTPESVEVLHNLGVIYISLKQYSEAEKYLLKEVSLYGESDVRCRVLGDLYFIEGNREEAGREYGKALAYLQKNGGDQKLAKFLRRRIKNCKDESSFKIVMEGAKYFEEGTGCYAEGKFMEALELYNRAIECDSSSYMALNAAGTLHLNLLKDYERAKQLFRKALEISDLPVIRMNLNLAENKIRENGGEL